MLSTQSRLEEGGSDMGYRSDVAYTIRFSDTDKGRQTFEIFLADAKQNEDTKGAFNEERSESHPDGCLIIDRVKLAINFRANDVKWYPDYTDVKCHDALIVLAKEYIHDLVHEDDKGECCMGCIFTIIGENLDDVQEDAHGEYDWGWIGIRREILTDWE